MQAMASKAERMAASSAPLAQGAHVLFGGMQIYISRNARRLEHPYYSGDHLRLEGTQARKLLSHDRYVHGPTVSRAADGG